MQGCRGAWVHGCRGVGVYRSVMGGRERSDGSRIEATYFHDHMSIRMFIYTCPCVRRVQKPVHTPTDISMQVSLRMSVHMPIDMSMHASLRMSVHIPIHGADRRTAQACVYMSMHMSIHMYMHSDRGRMALSRSRTSARSTHHWQRRRRAWMRRHVLRQCV